jgi:molybdenum cofactor biosynthesis protein B
LVITVSDGVSAGTREDRSGPALVSLLSAAGFAVDGPKVVPDVVIQIRDALTIAQRQGYALVLTTGGTGLGVRDVTPQATATVIEYEVPGLAEHIRRIGADSTLRAILSRGVAGVSGNCLIINLPGSEKGSIESASAVLPVLEHALALLAGDTEHSERILP